MSFDETLVQNIGASGQRKRLIIGIPLILVGVVGSFMSKSFLSQAVAFFGSIDPNWDDFFLTISGLVDPVDRVKGKVYFEKMVRILHWNRPGDEFAHQDDPIELKGDKLVREGERQEIPQKPAH